MSRTLEERAFDFAAATVRLVREIEPRTPAPVANRVCELGTLIGAAMDDSEGGPGARQRYTLVNEARRAAREIQYWLRLIADTDCATREDVEPFIKEARRLYPLLIAACSQARKDRDEKGS